MSPLPEVEELVEAARAGDAAAWDALVDRYLPLVTAVIRRLRLSPADADDVNQTVWLRLVEHLDRLREPRALPGWLATTARNEGLRQIRRRDRDLPVDPGGTTFDTAEDSDPGEALVEDLKSHALREAMLELPEKRRELLLMLLADPPAVLRRDQCPTGDPPGQHRTYQGTCPGTAAQFSGVARLGRRSARAARRCFRCLPRLTTTGSWRSWLVPWARWKRCPITAAKRPAPRSRGAPSTRSCWPSPMTRSSSPTPPSAACSTYARSASRVTDCRSKSRSTATGWSGRFSTRTWTRSSSSPSTTARNHPGRLVRDLLGGRADRAGAVRRTDRRRAAAYALDRAAVWASGGSGVGRHSTLTALDAGPRRCCTLRQDCVTCLPCAPHRLVVAHLLRDESR